MKKLYLILIVGMLLITTATAVTFSKDIVTVLHELGLTDYTTRDYQDGDYYVRQLKKEVCRTEVKLVAIFDENDVITMENVTYTYCDNVLDTQLITTNESKLDDLGYDRLYDIGETGIERENKVVVVGDTGSVDIK